MVSQELARLFITLLATALAARQALRATPGSRQRQAFTLGAAGFGAIAIGNGLVVLGYGYPALLTLVVGIGLALLIGCLVSLIIAVRDGELKDQIGRARAALRAEQSRASERSRRDEPRK